MFLLVAVFCLFGPAWLTPAMAIDLSGIKVTPSMTYEGEYDDNLFRTPSNEKSDYINHFIPGITLEATPGNSEIKAGGKADILRYSEFTNQDTERYYANLDSIFRFDRLELRLKEDFAHTDEFPSSELATRIKHNDNYLGGGFDYDVFERWGIGLDTTWGNIYYLDHSFDFLSENQYTYATKFYYRITEKTRVFGEYDFVQEWFGFDQTRNDNRHRALLGVSGDLTERLSLTAKGGYERLNFLSSTQSDQNQNSFVMSLEGNYKPVERLQISLLLSQEPIPSTFANNLVYTPFSATLGITYAFTPKILIIPRGYFGVDRYGQAALNADTNTQEKRLDYLYGGGLGIRYQLQKWIQLEANYDYQDRRSNFSTFNYGDNRIWFTVTLSM